MGMITLLRRLTGGADQDLAVDSRFREKLCEVDESNAELDRLKKELDELTEGVNARQRRISASNISSGMSAQHSLNLSDETEERESRPRQKSASDEF